MSSYLTKAEIAEMFQVSQRHVEKLVQHGKFPVPIRVGTLPRWRSTDVDEWAEDSHGRQESIRDARAAGGVK